MDTDVFSAFLNVAADVDRLTDRIIKLEQIHQPQLKKIADWEFKYGPLRNKTRAWGEILKEIWNKIRGTV